MNKLDELSSNASIIKQFKLEFNKDALKFDTFPNSFYLNFNAKNSNYKFKFTKIIKTDNSKKVFEKDIFIIDEFSDQPIKHVIENEEVFI